MLGENHNYSVLDNWGYPLKNNKVVPLPLGPFINNLQERVEEIKPFYQREYDFCFVGQMPHTGTRDKFKRCLDRLLEETGDKFKYYVKYTENFGTGLDHEEYIELLNLFFQCLRFVISEKHVQFYYLFLHDSFDP